MFTPNRLSIRNQDPCGFWFLIQYTWGKRSSVKWPGHAPWLATILSQSPSEFQGLLFYITARIAELILKYFIRRVLPLNTCSKCPQKVTVLKEGQSLLIRTCCSRLVDTRREEYCSLSKEGRGWGGRAKIWGCHQINSTLFCQHKDKRFTTKPTQLWQQASETPLEFSITT